MITTEVHSEILFIVKQCNRIEIGWLTAVEALMTKLLGTTTLLELLDQGDLPQIKDTHSDKLKKFPANLTATPSIKSTSATKSSGGRSLSKRSSSPTCRVSASPLAVFATTKTPTSLRSAPLEPSTEIGLRSLGLHPFLHRPLPTLLGPIIR